MDEENRSWKYWAIGGGGLGFLLCFALSLLDVNAAPGLLATRSTNHLILITVTNGTSTNVFEVYGRAGLEPEHAWSFITNGAMGQTNFLLPMYPGLIGFYRVGEGDNWDGDAALNWQDADPTNPNIGLLTITIDSPANGSVLQ